eukprot:7337354-Prymnesium_polylepis.2
MCHFGCRALADAPSHVMLPPAVSALGWPLGRRFWRPAHQSASAARMRRVDDYIIAAIELYLDVINLFQSTRLY